MYAAFVWMIMSLVAVCLSPQAKAEEIEEVVVVGQQSTTIKADPLKGNSFIRALLNRHTWTLVVMVLSKDITNVVHKMYIS